MDVNNIKINDIVSLSDLQTQKEFGEMSVDFIVKEVRTYKETNDLLKYTGLVCSYNPTNKEDDEQEIMVLVREFSAGRDVFVYYMDQDGDVNDYEIIFKSQEDEDLEDSFDVTLHFDEEDKKPWNSDVTWSKKALGTVFGVETTSTINGNDNKTIAEYYSEDDTNGNPHCFVEWTGSKTTGYLEFWYGCEIRFEDIEIFNVNEEEIEEDEDE